MVDELQRGDGERSEAVLLAEYSALRAEVERRCTIQWNVVALQITSAGTIAGLAISRVSNLALLLLIPLLSYMFGARYILHDYHIKVISRYFRESLSGRLGGQLQWDGWKKKNFTDKADNRWFSTTGWKSSHPTRLSFEGVAVLALFAAALAAPHYWSTVPHAWYIVAGFGTCWLVGAVATWLLHRAFEKSRHDDPTTEAE